MSFTLVHSRKVRIGSNEALKDRDRVQSTPHLAGILAVSVLSGINDGNESDSRDLSNAEIFQIQVASIAKDDNDDVSIASGMEKAPIVAFSARYTIEQISADLKAFDDSTLQRGHIKMGTEPHSASGRVNKKADYLLSLLKSASSQQEHELGCFLSMELTSDSATPRLQISIKERLQNGIVRILWSSVLPRVDEVRNRDMKSIDALFQLSVDLSEQHEHVLQKMGALKEQFQLLERDRDGWKDTAQKLEGQWEDEKSLLFHNFCTLYSGKKKYDDERIAELQNEIAKLKQELANASSSGTASTTTGAGRKSVLPDCLQNVPNDDHHRLPYDDETVRRLAQGEPVPMVKVKTEDTDDAVAYAAVEKQTKKRRNPVSGATEYQDAEHALQDILQPSSNRKKQKGNSSSTQDVRPKIFDVASAAVKQTRVKEQSHPPSGRGSDSDTGSDSDFIDKDMQAQIMADLEALRKI